MMLLIVFLSIMMLAFTFGSGNATVIYRDHSSHGFSAIVNLFFFMIVLAFLLEPTKTYELLILLLGE